MQRAATEVMQSILFSAVLDAHRGAEGRVGRACPTSCCATSRRSIRNVTFADLPKAAAGRDRGERRARLSPSC